MWLIPSFLLGFIGSLHCGGMCGPIALALPMHDGTANKPLRSVFQYNLARILTYSFIGLVVALLGEVVFMDKLHSGISILLGLVIILVAALSLDLEKSILKVPFFVTLLRPIQRRMGRLLSGQERFSQFKIGALNGLLPCGLVYMAILTALVSGSALKGGAMMFAFGIGTLPMMTTIPLLGATFKNKLRFKLRKWYPILLFSLGVLLVLRGVSFHLPDDFLLWNAFQSPPMCK